MSHFCVYVFHDKGTSIDTLLAPYDENIKMKPYIKYTRQQLIDKVRMEIEKYKNTTYAEYLANPAEFKTKYSYNELFVKFVEEEFPKQLNWTDEECYESEAKWYREDEMVDADGNMLSTCNPKSKWDWYEIGGRYSGNILGRNEIVLDSSIKTDEIDTPYAFITPDGDWHEKGEMGWWGLASNEKEEDDWEKEFKEYLNSVSNSNLVVTCVDCHI